MKNLGFILLSLFSGLSVASAEATPLLRIGFTVESFRSTPVNTITKLTITPLPSGKVFVTIDPNKCSLTPNGHFVCTKIKVTGYEVEVKIVKDNTPVDGPLVLDLSNNVHLEVSSGYSIDGIIRYTGVLGAGTDYEERLPLTTQVLTNLMKAP